MMSDKQRIAVALDKMCRGDWVLAYKLLPIICRDLVLVRRLPNGKIFVAVRCRV